SRGWETSRPRPGVSSVGLNLAGLDPHRRPAAAVVLGLHRLEDQGVTAGGLLDRAVRRVGQVVRQDHGDRPGGDQEVEFVTGPALVVEDRVVDRVGGVDGPALEGILLGDPCRGARAGAGLDDQLTVDVLHDAVAGGDGAGGDALAVLAAPEVLAENNRLAHLRISLSGVPRDGGYFPTGATSAGGRSGSSASAAFVPKPGP